MLQRGLSFLNTALLPNCSPLTQHSVFPMSLISFHYPSPFSSINMLQFVKVLLKQDTLNRTLEKLQMYSLTREKQRGTWFIHGNPCSTHCTPVNAARQSLTYSASTTHHWLSFDSTSQWSGTMYIEINVKTCIFQIQKINCTTVSKRTKEIKSKAIMPYHFFLPAKLTNIQKY